MNLKTTTTDPEAKISPAFDAFLAESGPHDKRDAIVIYRAPEQEDLPGPGTLRVLKHRLAFFKERAPALESMEAQIFKSYLKASSGSVRSQEPLNTATVGGSTLPVATVEVTRKTLPTLAEDEDVVAVLPNQRIHLIEPQAVNFEALRRQEDNSSLTWGLQQLDIPRMWETTTGRSVNVAVLDTGVHGEHAALWNRVKSFVVIDPLGRRINTDKTFDSGQHGTHVSGIIGGGKTTGGVAIGVAPDANLMAAAVLMGASTLRTLMEGISWAIEKGAHIINMSLGFSFYEPKFTEVFHMLINQYGILPVVAIGNSNHGNTNSPGSAYNALSVGAAERLSRGKVNVSFFSSGASLVFPGQAPPHHLVTKPDVVAPGAQVYSCIPPQERPDGTYEYTYMDGTSMAAPHVAGVAALLMAARRRATVPEIITALKETSSHPGGVQSRPDNRWGYGMIQPEEALKAIL